MPQYQHAMRLSGYGKNLEFQSEKIKKKRNRKRNIIWFNPPFNSLVKTNLGKSFFKLLEKHFPPQNRLHKICNKNAIKLSYSCMPNLSGLIASHNKKILESTGKEVEKACNCRIKKACPMSGKCRESCIVYKAEVSTNHGVKSYFWLCETEF